MSLEEFKRLREDLCGSIDACERWGHDFTPEIAKYIVGKDGYCIHFLPAELITEEIAWLAISTGERLDGGALMSIPDHLITYDMCLTAVKCEAQTYCALEFVPERFHTYELSIAAVSNRAYENGYALEFVLDRFKDENLYLKAIETLPDVIDIIPDIAKTARMRKLAHALKLRDIIH
jgi:hypothetical protein